METSEFGLAGDMSDAHAYHYRAESEIDLGPVSTTDLHQCLLASFRDELHFSFMWRLASVSVPMLVALSIWVLNP